jgi:hypothetical protein
MRVKVKEGQKGWYGGQMRRGKDVDNGVAVSDEFDIVARKHSVTGKTITVEQQFSERWMEKVDKSTRGRKKANPESED